VKLLLGKPADNQWIEPIYAQIHVAILAKFSEQV
jgi:hypothetical protein